MQTVAKRVKKCLHFHGTTRLVRMFKSSCFWTISGANLIHLTPLFIQKIHVNSNLPVMFA